MNACTVADVKSRINKARHAFAVLKLWKSPKITLRTKIIDISTSMSNQ